MSHHKLFARWSSKDCTSVESSNLTLLLLGAMRNLDRGCIFDDTEECAEISREVNRLFFHVYCCMEAQFCAKKHVSFLASTTDPSELEIFLT